ncbi:hypothetical protein ANCCAN_07168 [Ancylostoma caninum]|uniref:SCP domain-containing protein n=1 Tax=Ancylostoma caninum TaxID=29170 RepID=A0A368GU72_ANCCA|nr:hypothetical protein ANCCAN_07168 [Ancylostoma caninum]
MFPIVASVLLALVLSQSTRSDEKAPNCTDVMGEYAAPQKVRDPLFKKIPEAMNQTLKYNCTLENIASATANFDRFDAYVGYLYDEIPNLNQTVYKEKNDQPPTGERLVNLNISAFINNATGNWTDELKQMGEKTQFGCFLDEGYNFTLVCAFI